MKIIIANQQFEITLTPTQKTVLINEMTKRGFSLEEIAAALEISTKTVRRHKAANDNLAAQLGTKIINDNPILETGTNFANEEIEKSVGTKIISEENCPIQEEKDVEEICPKEETKISTEELPYSFTPMSEEEEQAIFHRIAANTKHLRRPTEQEIRNFLESEKSKWLPEYGKLDEEEIQYLESQKDSHFKQNGTYNLKISAARPKNPLLDFSW